MKAIKKVIVTMGLILFALISFACGNNGNENNNQNKNSSSSFSSSTESENNKNLCISCQGKSESIQLRFVDDNAEGSQIFIKPSNSNSEFIAVDKQLIRQTATSEATVDVVGLSEGSYSVKVITSDDKTFTIEDIAVDRYDRSGYAHFGFNEGVGAYRDDGTLKPDAKIIYVTDETKNSVTLGNRTGIANILTNASEFTFPLCIRIIGKISTRSWDAKDASYTANGIPCSSLDPWEQNTKNNDLEAGITDIIGLKDKISVDVQNYVVSGFEKEINYSKYPFGTKLTTYDSYFNVLEIKNGRNITVEGIGEGAEIFQWGMIWQKCNSIEVRNLTFTDYPEDACSILGDVKNPMQYSNFWFHNCLFNRGKNNWDITGPDQRDKADGDGSTDISGCHNVTVDYCKFNNCRKTGLIGGSDENLQFNVTFHHNYFYKCEARLPLGRQANIHYYNNYYQENKSCMELRANAYVFSEYNYFENCKSTFKISGATCKSFNDFFIGCDKKSATVVSDRESFVANSCAYGSSFDVDQNNFYYDVDGKKTNASYLTDSAQAKEDCINYSGVAKKNPK